MLADGLGHGPLAASAAERAAEVFSANPFDSPASILQNMHQSLKSTRGVAVAVALVNQTSGKVNYAGIGNIAAVLISSSRSRQGMISHHGTLGVQINSIRELEYTLPDRGLLIMHSDGLQSRWTLDGLPGLASRYADVIAATLYRDFGRGRDDASVMVLRLGVDHD
jgi:hypothetical protein